MNSRLNQIYGLLLLAKTQISNKNNAIYEFMSNPYQNTLLDDDFLNNWGNKIFKPGDILWEGKPDEKERSIYWLEGNHDMGLGVGGYGTGLGSMSLFVFLATIVLCFVGLDFYVGDGLSLFSYCLLFAFFAVAVIPDLYLDYSFRQTRYAITDSQVFFRLLHWGKPKIFVLNWEEVHRLTWEEYKNGRGTLYFMCHEKPDFYTHSFSTGDPRMHVTFELVPEVRQVFQKLEKLRKAKYVKKEIVPLKIESKSEIKSFAKKVSIFQGFVSIYLLFFGCHGIVSNSLFENYTVVLLYFMTWVVILISQLLLRIEKEKIDRFYLMRILVWTGLFLTIFLLSAYLNSSK